MVDDSPCRALVGALITTQPPGFIRRRPVHRELTRNTTTRLSKISRSQRKSADPWSTDDKYRHTSKPEIVQSTHVQGWKHVGVAWCKKTFDGRRCWQIGRKAPAPR